MSLNSVASSSDARLVWNSGEGVNSAVESRSKNDARPVNREVYVAVWARDAMSLIRGMARDMCPANAVERHVRIYLSSLFFTHKVRDIPLPPTAGFKHRNTHSTTAENVSSSSLDPAQSVPSQQVPFPQG